MVSDINPSFSEATVTRTVYRWGVDTSLVGVATSFIGMRQFEKFLVKCQVKYKPTYRRQCTRQMLGTYILLLKLEKTGNLQ